MNPSNKALTLLSSITNQLPYHRKFNQLYKHFNRLFLTFGAMPIVTARMKDGSSMMVDLSTKTERISFYTGKYDPELIQIIHSLIKPNSCFLDIGANIGFYTVSIGNFMKSKASEGKVIAFEPFEGNYQRLTTNIKANNLDDICIVNAYGLSNKSEQSFITLREDFKHGSKTGNAAIPTNKKMDDGFRLSPIKLETLDEIWSEYKNLCSNIDIIKMDIEGHEDFCLEGGLQIINEHRPTILMEVNKPYYKARNMNLDDRFFALIPSEYLIFRENNSKWIRMNSFEECAIIDNVFLIPIEKLKLEAYHIFENSK